MMKKGLEKKKFLFLISFLFIASLHSSIERGAFEPKKVALCIVATGKYTDFAKQLIKSAERFFLPKHDVTYILFSDMQIELPHTILIYQAHQSWPFSTLLRFEMYAKQQKLLSSFDYIFAIDADMLFVSRIGDEILHELVATLHPGFAVARKNIFPFFDSNALSKAYIPSYKRNSPYFAGALFGGAQRQFLNLIETCSKNIQEDLELKIIAKYHDESHLNWYFRENRPTKILSPSYCYTSSEEKAKQRLIHRKFKPKILCLEKEHLIYQK